MKTHGHYAAYTNVEEQNIIIKKLQINLNPMENILCPKLTWIVLIGTYG